MEEQLINDININNLDTLEKLSRYFKENGILSEHYNDFKQTLIYFIKNEFPENCIRYLMNQQKNKANNTEALFYSLEQKNFKIAELLLRNKVNMFKKIKDNKNRNGYSNVLEYCGKRKKNRNGYSNVLDIIEYILSRPQASPKLITTEYLSRFFVKEKWSYEREYNRDMIDFYFNYKFRNNNEESCHFLLNQFIIFGYKIQRPLSTDQLLKLINEFKRKGVVIDLNKRNYGSSFPLLIAIANNDIVKIKSILNYVERVGYPLNINQISKSGHTPFYTTVKNYNFESMYLLLEYSIRNSIKIDYNDICQLFLNLILKYKPLYINYLNKIQYWNSFYYDERKKFKKVNTRVENIYKAMKSLIKYAKHFQIELNLNFTDDHGQYPISTLIYFLKKRDYCNDNDLIEVVQLLIDYAEHQHIILEFVYLNYDGKYVLQELKNEKPEITKLFIDYAERNHITLECNMIGD